MRSAEAEMMIDTLDESGCWCRARATIADTSAPRPSNINRHPMVPEAIFSTLSMNQSNDHELCDRITYTYLTSFSLNRTALSRPGFATFLNLHKTMKAESTSIPDWIPKKTSDREDDSAPNPMEIPPSAPL